MSRLLTLGLLGLLLAAPQAADAAIYEIRTHSAESWAHYFRMIGLGRVERQENLRDRARGRLEAHCAFLEGITGYQWIALGYSRELGHKLCYRTGPFDAKQAKTFCARLVMRVKHHGPRRIVCENGRESFYYYPGENPHVRRLPPEARPPVRERPESPT